MNKPEAVAFVAGGNERYGIGTVITTLADGVARLRIRPIVLAFNEGMLVDACREQGWQTEVLGIEPPPVIRRSVAGVLRGTFAYRAFSKRAKKSLLGHLQTAGAPPVIAQVPTHLFATADAAAAAGSRCYWMMPNVVGDHWPLGINRRIYEWQIQRHRITPLPNSRFTAKTLSEAYVPNVLYLGIDCNRFNSDHVPTLSRDELGIPTSDLVYGVFSRLHGEKGQERFWEAMLEADPIANNLHLLVVGSGDESIQQRMIAAAERRGAAKHLHFTGWTSEPEKYYGVVDIAVNSRINSEPFGLSVIEAMAMGKPVLAHAFGGPAETVLDGETGWHMPEASVSAYRTGIDRTLADRLRWEEMGAAARQRAVSEFSTEVFVENFLAKISGN